MQIFGELLDRLQFQFAVHAELDELESAGGAVEKLAVVLTIDYLRREANAGRREEFEKYLAAMRDVPPGAEDRMG